MEIRELHDVPFGWRSTRLHQSAQVKYLTTYLLGRLHFIKGKAHGLLDALSRQIQRLQLALPLLVVVPAEPRELQKALLGALALYLGASHCRIAAPVRGLGLFRALGLGASLLGGEILVRVSVPGAVPVPVVGVVVSITVVPATLTVVVGAVSAVSAVAATPAPAGLVPVAMAVVIRGDGAGA